MIKDYIDEDVAYLLGLITSRGFIKEGRTKEIVIEFPFKGLVAVGIQKRITQKDSIKVSLIDVVSRVEELTDSRVRQVEERHSIKLIIESLRNTLFWRNIKLILNNKMSFAEFGVPKVIIEAEPQIKKEFIRGFADVAGSARFSNRDEAGKCRIYLDVLNQNWILPIQMCYLLQNGLGIPVRNITWGHPNIRDPALKDYNRNRKDAWAREHQIRVYAEDFLKIGFYIRHKQEILEELAQFNKENFSESNFCSPPKLSIRKKQNHPEEESEKLPQRIRGKHYDAYWQICCDLGCVRCANNRASSSKNQPGE